MNDDLLYAVGSAKHWGEEGLCGSAQQGVEREMDAVVAHEEFGLSALPWTGHQTSEKCYNAFAAMC